MASGLIGALRVTLGLDTANFDADARKAKSKARGLAQDVKKELSGAFDLKGAALGLIGAIGISELAALASRSLEYASSLAEVAQQLGVTTKDLQSYRYAASQVGISQESMDVGLAKLTRSIGAAAAGSKVQAEAFRELGVSVKDGSGNILTAGDVIPRLADALSKIKDPASRARYEVELFGKSGQQLDTLLAGGSGQINNLRDAAQRLGLVLSEDTIAKADHTADKLAELKQVLEANIANAVANNAGAIYGLADSLTTLAASIPAALQRWKQWRNENAIRLADATDKYFGFLPESIKGTGAARRQAQLSLQEMKVDDAVAHLGLGPGLSFLNRNKRAAPTSGDLPVVGGTGGGGGRGRKRGGSAGAKSAGGDWLAELQKATREAINDGIRDGITDPDKDLADHARRFYDQLGIDPSADLKKIVDESDKRKDSVMREAETRADANELLFQRRQEQERTLADLYTNLMTGGTKSFLQTLQQMGLQIIAQMAAGLTMGKSLSGAFNGALGAVLPGFGLPGFATGGSFRVGGVGGVDRNVVAFKATRGEIVDIRRPGNDNGGRGSTVEIIPSPFFDVQVRKASAPVGQAAAVGGSRMAQTEIARKNRRRLG